MDDAIKVAILISGRGSNMQVLAEAIAQDNYPAKVVGVISDKPDAAGLGIAKDMAIPTKAFDRKDYESKREHEADIESQLKAWNTDIVCLAGYMRLLSAEFTENWPARLINIHPSLLPKFKGLDTHARVLKAGDPEHGTTVHFVTAGMDEGPTILQARVKVAHNDTEETLAARVLEQEHILYPAALLKLINNLTAKNA